MLRELVEKNRSYRGYDESRRISKEELMELVDLTLYTASGTNKQPLKFYLAWEKEVVDKIQPLTGWAMGLPHLTLPHPGKCPTAFIVICHDKSVSDNISASQRETGAMAQTILLGAVEKGLGGCMIGSFQKAELMKTLGLAENLPPVLLVALGKPDETVKIVPVGEDGSTAYYRDENDVHYVPKRALEDIIL